MNRRIFLFGTTFIATLGKAFAQVNDPLKILLAEISANPQEVEDAWLFREPSVSRGVGKGTPSKRILSLDSTNLIIAFEVASPQAYEARYRRPIWPKGASGVTIGVGYDLRFANKSNVDRDWPTLSKQDRSLLYSVCALGGSDAKVALPRVQAVDIPWPLAKEQFLTFLPYPTQQTEEAFGPNCRKLPDDAFGALVSLVYNRGPAISRNSKQRLEMYEIQRLMHAGNFKAIPDRIRAMKRIWESDPNARGLLRRREAEALLFEQGLRSF